MLRLWNQKICKIRHLILEILKAVGSIDWEDWRPEVERTIRKLLQLSKLLKSKSALSVAMLTEKVR